MEGPVFHRQPGETTRRFTVSQTLIFRMTGTPATTHDMSPPRFTMVVPAYQEEARLPQTLATLAARPELWADGEVLLVVEPGTDATAAIAREGATRHRWLRALFPPVHRGKGGAVRAGLAAARGPFAGFMDADLSTGLDALPAALTRLQAGPGAPDIIIGNRQHPSSLIARRQNRLRESMGQVFNKILRFLGSADFADTQCGFKVFNRRALDLVLPRLTVDGFAFDVEILLVAKRLGLRVEDLPVEWRDAPKSKVRLVRDSLLMLKDAVLIRWRTRKIRPLPDAFKP
jgi:dolichyl-phosphate beta-glucosyltransferase